MAQRLSQHHSIYTVGQIVGGLMSGFLSDNYGRRAGMFAGCALVVLGKPDVSDLDSATSLTRSASGSILTSSSHHIQQFTAGRFVLGWGISIAASCGPSYCIEIAPPQWRGRMTAFYNTGWFGGSIPAAAITLGTSYMTTNWAWRIPLMSVSALTSCNRMRALTSPRVQLPVCAGRHRLPLRLHAA